MLKEIIQFFVPKDKIFFKLFENVAVNTTSMANKLVELVYEPNSIQRKALLMEIEKIEKDNDNLTHELFVELGRNFITPLDREDIYALASSLDDVADFIYMSAKKIVFHNVDPNDLGIQKLSELIHDSVKQTEIIILQLSRLKKLTVITEAIIKINSIENQADDIYVTSIQQLFDQENDFKELIKKREIYNALEIATDKCEDVSNVVETILIKYA